MRARRRALRARFCRAGVQIGRGRWCGPCRAAAARASCPGDSEGAAAHSAAAGRRRHARGGGRARRRGGLATRGGTLRLRCGCGGIRLGRRLRGWRRGGRGGRRRRARARRRLRGLRLPLVAHRALELRVRVQLYDDVAALRRGEGDRVRRFAVVLLLRVDERVVAHLSLVVSEYALRAALGGADASKVPLERHAFKRAQCCLSQPRSARGKFFFELATS